MDHDRDSVGNKRAIDVRVRRWVAWRIWQVRQCWRHIGRILDYLYLRWHGVETRFGYVRLDGWPIIRKCPGSRIIVGPGVSLISSSRGNVAGINHPVILATLTGSALIHLDSCGVSGAAICAATSIRIGPNSGLGVNCSVYDTDFHPIDPELRRQQHGILDAATRAVLIGRDVWVGANALVLKGVTIGDGAVVGAGSVVVKDVQPFELVAGNPARHVRFIKVRCGVSVAESGMPATDASSECSPS